MRYVWLVYLGALLFQPLFDPASGLVDWAVIAGLLAVFLPLYVAGYRAANSRQMLLIAAAMAALGVAGSVVNGGASVFVIYGAAIAAYVEPFRRAVLAIIVLVAILLVMLVVSPVPAPFRFIGLLPALVFTIVTGAANLLDAERERARGRLRRAEDEIERLAAIAERERIARDLHDLLGHTLSVIVVKSELATRLAETQPMRAAKEMRDVEHIGREALAEVRAVVVGFRAQSLAGELEGARRALAAVGVPVTVKGDVPALPVAVESGLALALRESITNVLRHANAKSVVISIVVESSRIVLEVTDDGVGGSHPDGAGLMGMRERIAALGGLVERGGASGTQVRITVPVEAATGIAS
jgi:two-component system sensor histidine kinase DesK